MIEGEWVTPFQVVKYSELLEEYLSEMTLEAQLNEVIQIKEFINQYKQIETVLNAFEGQILQQMRERREVVIAAPQQLKNGESKYGDVKWVMEQTGAKRQTVYNWVSKRTIPHVKKGSKLLFDKQEILEWIGDGKRPTKTEIELEAMERTVALRQ